MVPGKEVRLKNAYIVKCTGCKKAADGTIEIYAEYESQQAVWKVQTARLKVHSIGLAQCVKAEVRLYDRLFTGNS